jgi:hypothetical protein
MGRFIKNEAIHTPSYAVRVPMGSDTLGPQFPEDGQVHFNTSNGLLEFYTNNKWQPVGLAGRVAIVKDTFVGNGVLTSFPISVGYDTGHEQEMLVYIGNIFQNPGVAYTVNQYMITFSSPPDANIVGVVLHNFNSTKVV